MDACRKLWIENVIQMNIATVEFSSIGVKSVFLLIFTVFYISSYSFILALQIVTTKRKYIYMFFFCFYFTGTMNTREIRRKTENNKNDFDLLYKCKKDDKTRKSSTKLMNRNQIEFIVFSWLAFWEKPMPNIHVPCRFIFELKKKKKKR